MAACTSMMQILVPASRIGRHFDHLNRQAFLQTPLDRLVLDSDTGSTRPSTVETAATELIRAASTHVTAYRKFLQHDSMEFADLGYTCAPVTSKASYVNAFGWNERRWGDAEGCDPVTFIHCSSGSTGSPTMWPRTLQAELTVAATFERVFHDAFEAMSQSTLVVVAFPLGTWVGGLFTTICVNYLSMKGYKTTLVTPGNKVDDILDLIPRLAPQFSQTVLLGYPPFVKGVIDAGVAAGVPWPAFNLGLVLAGEVFSEAWRQLVAHRAAVKQPHRRIVSLYGTADAGVIAAESAVSAAMRDWLAQHPPAARDLFGAERLPTLCQYDPANRLLDRHPDDGSLVVTCLTPAALQATCPESGRIMHELVGPPVLKYSIGDAGGIIGFDDLCAFLDERGCDVTALLQAAPVRRLPFVWVFGRAFWCVSVYGANVYVENVMSGLEQSSVAPLVTGKFVLLTEEDADLDKRLLVRVECAHGVVTEASVAETVSASITAELLRLNSEYASYVPKDRQQVKVLLHGFGDATYFPIGVKHRYTI